MGFLQGAVHLDDVHSSHGSNRSNVPVDVERQAFDVSPKDASDESGETPNESTLSSRPSFFTDLESLLRFAVASSKERVSLSLSS